MRTALAAALVDWWYVAVAVLAFVVRLAPVLIGGSLGSTGRYDDSVYYAAGDALTWGRVPYRDFVLLHPPGIALVLAPFALLGRVTSDHAGMSVAQVAFMLLGAANAVMVALIARRWGRVPAVAAGMMYACWQPAVYAEQATLLEPLGTAAILGALLLVLDQERPVSRPRLLFAGALLGCALTVKIWYAAPVLVIIGWVLLVHHRRVVLDVIAGCAVVAAAVLLPFFVLAPRRMFDLVVRDQLARSAASAPRSSRLTSIFGAQTLTGAHSTQAHLVTVVVGALVIVAALVCLLIDVNARLLALLLATCLAVLLSGPTYFGHYAELTAAPIVLVTAVGLPTLGRRVPVRVLPALAAVVAVAVAGYAAVHVASTPAGRSVAWGRLAAAAPSGCIASDSPEPLIGMNRLSSDLSAGCQVPVDVGGYGYDLLTRVHGRSVYVSRARNPAWQTFLYRYLTGAAAFVLVRGRGEIMPTVYRELTARRAFAQVDGFALRATNK